MAFSDNIITATSELLVTDGVGGSVFADVIPSGNKMYVLGKLGVGTLNPVNALDVEGGAAVGAGYSGSTTAPSNGLIVEGNVGIGATVPAAKLDVAGTLKTSHDAYLAASSGNVGIGTSGPVNKLDVNGDVALSGKHAFRSNDSWLRLNQDGAFASGAFTPGLLASGALNVGGVSGWGNPGAGNAWIAGTLTVGSNPVRFTSAWSGFPDATTNQAEISNDTGTYRTLMIVGNRSSGLGRRVSVWDRLEVNGNMAVTGSMTVAGGGTVSGAFNVNTVNFDRGTYSHEVTPGNVWTTGLLSRTFPTGSSGFSWYQAAVAGVSQVAGTIGVSAIAPAGTYALRVSGTSYFSGAKTGYVADIFASGNGKRLQTGDVVRLIDAPIRRFFGDDNKLPVAQVAWADKEHDSRVIGIVDREALPDQDAPDIRVRPEDPTSIEDGGELFVVTLGVYAHCKADASGGPIQVGDLLTPSANAGFAMKASNPKPGAIIGKALEPLKEGTGYIAVFVNIQ